MSVGHLVTDVAFRMGTGLVGATRLARMRLQITDVKVAIIEGNWDWGLVKIGTSEGLYGLGEASLGTGLVGMVDLLRPLLIGEDPLSIQRLVLRMTEVMSGSGSSSLAGPMAAAISGVEIALWDLAGKAIGVPTHVLWGGALRDRLRVYCDAGVGSMPDPAAWRARAAEVSSRGFTAYKFDVDFENRMELLGAGKAYVQRRDPLSRSISVPELRLKVALIEAVRDELGSDVDLAVDCHWAYNTADAIRLANALSHLGLLWLEDPVPMDNPAALADLRSHTSVPVCTGENAFSRREFRQLMEQQACDVVHPDIPRCGGLMEGRRIADLADLYYVGFAAHNVCSPVGTIAAAHLCATVRPFVALEFHAVDVDWWEDMVEYGGPVIVDGHIRLSDRPGFGIELNSEVCLKHAKPGTAYF